MVSAVEDTGLTTTFSGLSNICRDKSKMFLGIVAEKNKDCLLCGNIAKIFLMS